MDLGSAPAWTAYNNLKPVNNYAAMFNAGQNAVNVANAAFTARGLETLNADDLVITSAGYSEVNGLSFGALDGVISVAGTNLENMFSLKRGLQTPLWFVFVKNPTSANGPLYAVFVDALGNVVPVVYNGTSSDVFDISGVNLAGTSGSEGWKRSEAVFNAYTYSIPSYAQQDFYIVSLANLWVTGMPYDFLRPSCDGGCPGSGLSQGYLILNYIKTVLPLGPNDYYIYMGIPAHCKEQVLLNGLGVSPAEGTYFTPGVQSSSADPNSVGIAIRWNSITNTGTAILIDYDKTILGLYQPPNSYWYKTMYWADWYLQQGFPGTTNYNELMKAYSIGTIGGKAITITQSDLNTIVAAGGDPVAFVKNFVTPVIPPVTPTTNPQPGDHGTGISAGIALTSDSIAQAASGITDQTAAPGEIAPGLPLADNPAQAPNNSGIPVVPLAGAVLIVVILVLVYLGRNSISSAIRGSEKIGK
jgi:formylmethanofuran dehydrogenase subunit E-like metal-binding protein